MRLGCQIPILYNNFMWDTLIENNYMVNTCMCNNFDCGDLVVK